MHNYSISKIPLSSYNIFAYISYRYAWMTASASMIVAPTLSIIVYHYLSLSFFYYLFLS